MIVVTAEEMREMDRLTIQKCGVPSLTLSVAGLAAYSYSWKIGLVVATRTLRS